jgi:hypothetical protein
VNPEIVELLKPERKEWRLPDRENSLTGEMEIIRHNSNGPAVTTTNGYQAWYENGLRHRNDGPAIEYEGFSAWYQNGKAHRLGGPAKIFSDGTKQWWIDGVRTK